MKTCYLLFIILFFSTAIAVPLQIPSVAIAAVSSQHGSAPTNAHTQVITAKTIKQSGAKNLEQILNGLAGIQLNDLTGDGSHVTLGMRGFGANAGQNSLVLLNGMPLNNPDLSVPNLNLIPLNAIKQIEIYNGSESVLFGDQAVGGVINIITKTPLTDSMYASTLFGSFATSIYREGFEVIGKNNLYASVNVNKNSTNNYRDHNQNNTEQVYGSVGQQQATSGWNLNYNVSQQLLNLAGALTAAQVAANRRQAQNNINFTNTTYQTYQFQQYHWLTNTWKESFAAMHRDQKDSGVLFDPFTDDDTENWGQISVQGLISSVLLSNGLSLSDASYGLNGSGFFTSDKQKQVDIFSQVNIPLSQKFSFILGARAADQDNELLSTAINNANQTAFVTNIGLNYQWKPWLQLFLRRAGNFRFPKADEEALTANGVGGLKMQQGVSYELGVNANKNNWYGTASLFLLNLNNEIAFNQTPLPNTPFGVNSNLDPTRRIGGLLNINDQLTPAWLLGAQYTHVAAIFTEGMFKNNNIPFVPENSGSLYANYQFLTHWNLFAKIIFIGSEFSDGDDANTFPKMPAVTLLNLALRYQRHYVFAVFRINNVFNRYYNAYSSVNTISIMPFQQQQFFYPAPGRSFFITLGFNLA